MDGDGDIDIYIHEPLRVKCFDKNGVVDIVEPEDKLTGEMVPERGWSSALSSLGNATMPKDSRLKGLRRMPQKARFITAEREHTVFLMEQHICRMYCI